MDKSKDLMLYSWQITIAGIIVSLGVTIVFWNQIPPLVPLFYSRPWGADQLVSKFMIFLVPALALLIQTGNQVLYTFTKEETLIRKLGSIVSIVSTLMLTLGLLRIVFLIA